MTKKRSEPYKETRIRFNYARLDFELYVLSHREKFKENFLKCEGIMKKEITDVNESGDLSKRKSLLNRKMK